jgi:2-amino-4-hydroxy-6-hydroxymethyldihydropteridine diphosphokinase
MTQVFLSLGSNQGDRFSFIKKSVKELEYKVGQLVSISSYYETEPWGYNSKTFFINQVICLNTNLTPAKLLEEILNIEEQLGRNRYLTNQFYSDRCIDIDILLYGDEIVEYTDLKIPHKYMHERKFVLEPLNEIARDLIHPSIKKSVKDLLSCCYDKTNIKKIFEDSVVNELI